VSKWREEAGGGDNKLKFDYALAECKWVAQKYKALHDPLLRMAPSRLIACLLN